MFIAKGAGLFFSNVRSWESDRRILLCSEIKRELCVHILAASSSSSTYWEMQDVKREKEERERERWKKGEWMDVRRRRLRRQICQGERRPPHIRICARPRR